MEFPHSTSTRECKVSSLPIVTISNFQKATNQAEFQMGGVLHKAAKRLHLTEVSYRNERATHSRLSKEMETRNTLSQLRDDIAVIHISVTLW